MTIQQHKMYEYLGDGLYNFLARECLLTLDNYRESYGLTDYIKNNKFMAAVAIKIGLKPHPDKFDTLNTYGNLSPYPYADQLEVEIYLQFLAGGYEQAKKYFIDTVLPFCPDTKTAVEFTSQMVIPIYLDSRYFQ